MMMRLNLLALCSLLLLAVIHTQAVPSSPRIRGLVSRQLEDQQAGDDAAAAQQDDWQQEEEQEEEEQQEDQDNEDYGDDVFQEEDTGGNKVGQMFETAPENWTAEQWSFMVFLFIGWGALTSCICATGWLCSCLGCVGGSSAKEQPYGYDPSASAKQGDEAPAGCCPSSQDYVAMTGTETNHNSGAYS